ncbi:hypothetical protein [Microvirga tunisiensis]|nr:hypothetical protein [Microvirga tunisiensis]
MHAARIPIRVIADRLQRHWSTIDRTRTLLSSA